MKNLQRSLDDVVVQRCPSLPQEQREFVPIFLHIKDGLAKAGVRLHLPFRELLLEPRLQILHPRPALELMEVQALFG